MEKIPTRDFFVTVLRVSCALLVTTTTEGKPLISPHMHDSFDFFLFFNLTFVFFYPLGSIKSCSLCVGCGGAITDKFILRVQPDLEWHARCLRCVKCNRGLDEKNTCFVKDGKTYCKEDYQKYDICQFYMTFL